SGPTTAFLARDAESAGAVAEALRTSGTCRAVRITEGPAPGATVR
ncbi:MAG: 4-diphosphocytidyl-2-C-methyl-D-erythritol kinase, partial [Streptomyces sp.]|nr:4-diphosphocytidyl-2-C-methyl-D-erythritol kinase [Streptomyces sp.]